MDGLTVVKARGGEVGEHSRDVEGVDEYDGARTGV